MCWRTGNDNGIKGSRFRPALVTISDAHENIGVVQLSQQAVGTFAQYRLQFNGIYFLAQFGQDSRLVPGACTNFQYPVCGSTFRASVINATM